MEALLQGCVWARISGRETPAAPARGSVLGSAEPDVAAAAWPCGVCFWELESCRGELWLWVLGTSPGRLAADPVLP